MVEDVFKWAQYFKFNQKTLSQSFIQKTIHEIAFIKRIFSLSDYNEDSKSPIYNFIFKFICYVVETQKPINQFSAIIQRLKFKTCKLLKQYIAEVRSTAGGCS